MLTVGSDCGAAEAGARSGGAWWKGGVES